MTNKGKKLIALAAALLGVLFVLSKLTGSDPATSAEHLAEPAPSFQSADHLAGFGEDSGVSQAAASTHENHRAIRREFDSLLSGNEAIDAFIVRHLARAQRGDADSAIYVAEAMRYCVLDLNMLQQTIDAYQIQPTDPKEIKDAILAQIVGVTDFQLAEAERHIDRGFECRRLGWSVSEHRDSAKEWELMARENGQALAVARAASVNPESQVTPERLAESKVAMREALKTGREFRVFMYASTVVSASLQSDYELEKLSWMLLACEYESCDSLNYYNRGLCDILGAQAQHVCTDGVTDREFLFRMYPALFDQARERAALLKDAIESSQ